jgi:hypothetical protein
MSRRARMGSPAGATGWGPGSRGPVSVQVRGGVAAKALGRLRRMASVGPGVGHGAVAAGAGVDRVRGVLLRRGEGGADLGAGAAAGVGEAEGGEPGEGSGVAGEVVGLAQDRLGPGEAEPGEVLVDGGLVGGAAASAVDVLDAEEEGAALGSREVPGGQRREGVAEVERAGRRGGEAGAQGRSRRRSRRQSRRWRRRSSRAW